MDTLLIVPLKQNLPEALLASLRQAGWRISVTTDIMRAKQLLQKGDIAGVIMEFNPAAHDLDRLKVLRFVREFCPNVMVTMLHSGVEGAKAMGAVNTAVNTMDEINSDGSQISLDLFNLSPAQKRIAELVAQAYPNREIARKLQIKEQSVRNELSRIFKKMGVWNRVELALLMRKGPASKGQSVVTESTPVWAQIDPPPEAAVNSNNVAV